MTTLFWRLRSRWHDLQVADAETQDELRAINLQRLRTLALFLGALIAVYVAVFWPFGVAADTAQAAWRRQAGMTHLAFLAWWVAVGAAATAVRPLPVRHGAPMALQFLAPLGSLLFCVALTVIDQVVTPNTTPFLIGSVAIGLLMLVPPGTAILVHTIGYAALFFGLALTQRDATLLLNNRTDSLAVSLVSILLAAMLWRKDASVRMARKTIERKNEELKRAAEYDALTGVYNRAEFLRLADVEVLRARRRGTPISAIMLDLDHFKRVNDSHGHQAGDAVLVQAARVLSQGVRGTDLLGRMGGEEFMLLLPDTGNDAALGLAMKLCTAVGCATFDLPGGRSLAVTASCGVSTLEPAVKRELDWLYASADHALYDAKRAGRNRVRNASGLSSLSTSDFQRLRV